MAIFCYFGILARDKERIIISLINHINLYVQTFSKHTGIESNSHGLDGHLLSSIDFSSSLDSGAKYVIYVILLVYHV